MFKRMTLRDMTTNFTCDRSRCAGVACVWLLAIVAAWPALALAAPITPMGQFAGVKPVHDVDRILVVVNDDVITHTELIARVKAIKRDLAAQKIKLPPDAVLTRQVLERLVLERIQLQFARNTGIRASDRAVDRAVEQVAKRNGVTPEAVYRGVRLEGVDVDTYRKEIRDQVTLGQLVEREVQNRVNVSETEVDNFLATRREQPGAENSYNISLILIGVPEAATPDERAAAERRAKKLRQSLMEGFSFEEAAISYSQGQNALKGGALGWKNPGQLPGLFLGALKDLQPGDISEIINSPVGFHILKLNGRRQSGGAGMVRETHVRHILLRPSENRSIADVRSTLLQLRERIVNGDSFADLARSHSEDATSAAKGGDLGWVRPGQTVPEFENQMDRLASNQISEPVETPFGTHLIQVIARREQDVSGERNRAAARQQIRARKADELYDQWLRRLRDEAYVQYRLEDEY